MYKGVKVGLAGDSSATHLLVYVGRIAAIVDDEDDQAVGPDDAQCQDQNQHRLDRLRNAYVGDEVVARVARV